MDDEDGAVDDDRQSPRETGLYEFIDLSATFDTATLESIRAASDVSSESTAAPFDYVEQKQRQKIERTKNENDMRVRFFGWSSKLAGWMIAVNFLLFAAYLAIEAFLPEANVPEAVMLAWITATVVEIIGVVLIVAKHLFPGKKWNPTGKQAVGK
ncbi:hypothetical protein [Rathayibacter sp. PhB151]|uniref:hypothetical protein n=1 Tax=Rathayibacter sp. PhB151 TaxID=2485189 RepID=UPI001064612A|nr:hypothetical protein [Rathayibacter sp. PhB151]